LSASVGVSRRGHIHEHHDEFVATGYYGNPHLEGTDIAIELGCEIAKDREWNIIHITIVAERVHLKAGKNNISNKKLLVRK